MPPRRAGFTLVELVVAFILLAIGIVAILELVGQSALNARLARDRTQAALLAQQRLEALLAQPDLQPGTSEGDFGDRFPQFRWRAQIEQVGTAPEQTQAPFYLVTVVVEWQEGMRPQSVRLDTLWTPIPLTSPLPATDVPSASSSLQSPPGSSATGGRTP